MTVETKKKKRICIYVFRKCSKSVRANSGHTSRYSSSLVKMVARNCISLRECRECHSNPESVTQNSQDIQIKSWDIPLHFFRRRGYDLCVSRISSTRSYVKLENENRPSNLCVNYDSNQLDQTHRLTLARDFTRGSCFHRLHSL